jgi:predicted RNA-binding Zn ribbon-like protein
MQFNTYTAAGAHIAAALVNSPAIAPGELTDLLLAYEVHKAGDTADLREWTARLRPAFETLPMEQAAAVDALLVDADCRPRLVTHDGQAPHIHHAPLDAPLDRRVMALTAAGLAQLIADGAGPRLGHCHRDGCTVVFVDTSRNGRRRYCSVRCANVTNVARHRARRALPTAGFPQSTGACTGQPVLRTWSARRCPQLHTPSSTGDPQA